MPTDEQLGRIAYDKFHEVFGLTRRFGPAEAPRSSVDVTAWGDLEIDRATGKSPVREKWTAIAAAVAKAAQK
jgi:hypothetical protein